MSKDTARQRPLNVLVVGDSCQDVFVRGICARLSPEAPIPVLDHVSVETRHGMAGNVVRNLESLGCKTHLLTNLEPIKKTRFVDDKTGQHILRYDETPSVKRMSDVDVRWVTQNIGMFDALVFVDYCKGFLDDWVIEHVSYHLAKKGVPMYVDSKRCDLSSYQSCHIKLNEAESVGASSMPMHPYELIVTSGPGGAEHGGHVYPPREPIRVCDVVGAGDTFLAAYVHAHLSTGDIPTAIRFANDCAASVVKQFGTSVPTVEAIAAAKAEHLGG